MPLQGRLVGRAICDHVEPVTIPPVLGHAMLVGRQDDFTFASCQALDIDKSKLAPSAIETRGVITLDLRLILPLPALQPSIRA